MSNVASVGRVVHVVVDPAKNNGTDIAPAMITRVWGEPYDKEDGLGPRVTVNVRVLLDQNDVPWMTSIALFDTRPGSDVPSAPGGIGFWPPRVG